MNVATTTTTPTVTHGFVKNYQDLQMRLPAKEGHYLHKQQNELEQNSRPVKKGRD
jgi:hypothetical protein